MRDLIGRRGRQTRRALGATDQATLADSVAGDHAAVRRGCPLVDASTSVASSTVADDDFGIIEQAELVQPTSVQATRIQARARRCPGGSFQDTEWTRTAALAMPSSRPGCPTEICPRQT